MNKKYFIEIRGCNFHNKGDVLMAESVIYRIAKKRPDIEFFTRVINTQKSLFEPKKLGKCLTARPTNTNQNPSKFLLKLFVNNFFIRLILIHVFNFIPESKIDGVIDVCGFSYGNFWGDKNLKSDYEYYSGLKKRNIPVILMPKSFGPFIGKAQKEMMQKLWNMSTLAFSRDSQSSKYLRSCGIKNIENFPDYTFDAKPIAAQKYKKYFNRPLIIPNYRMVDIGKKFSFNSYINFLCQIYKIFELEFNKPALVIHDSRSDFLIASEIGKRFGGDIDIINEPVARVIKDIIKNSSMVYSDRLHGAISAGLHSVPIMTLGWSFKYREMLGDYDLKWAQIKYSSEQQMLNSVLRIIKKYKNIQNFKASFSVEKIRFQNKLMWNKIFYQLNKLLPPKK